MPISTDAHFQAWMTAPEDRRQAAHAALIGSLQATRADDRTYSLKELPPFFGLSHYTSLARLKVQRVAINYGGRNRYRVEDVRRWLLSDECKAIREERRRARKARDRAENRLRIRLAQLRERKVSVKLDLTSQLGALAALAQPRKESQNESTAR
jgi:hypothetical protein